MSILYEEWRAESPYAQTVARIQTLARGDSLIRADTHSYIYVTRLCGKTTFTIGGPITQAVSLPQVEGAESVGIRLKLGTFIPDLPLAKLVNGVITLPEASGRAFWLNGSAWEYPTCENADVFIDRLVRAGVLMREPIVEDALQGHLSDISERSVQRRFLRATGLSHRAMRHIQRAQHAARLLEGGTPILDAAFEAGYFDQPHLNRAMKQLMGQTPAQIAALRASV